MRGKGEQESGFHEEGGAPFEGFLGFRRDVFEDRVEPAQIRLAGARGGPDIRGDRGRALACRRLGLGGERLGRFLGARGGADSGFVFPPEGVPLGLWNRVPTHAPDGPGKSGEHAAAGGGASGRIARIRAAAAAAPSRFNSSGEWIPAAARRRATSRPIFGRSVNRDSERRSFIARRSNGRFVASPAG